MLSCLGRVFGERHAVRLAQLTVPSMQARGGGRIINVTTGSAEAHRLVEEPSPVSSVTYHSGDAAGGIPAPGGEHAWMSVGVYRRVAAALRRVTLAFQIAAAVLCTASVTTLQRIRPAGPVTDTAAIAWPQARIGAATHTSSS
jgi:NAD(P)-dependent dehydrogenase (short-subunit alcohol dehydrogenase family)